MSNNKYEYRKFTEGNSGVHHRTLGKFHQRGKKKT